MMAAHRLLHEKGCEILQDRSLRSGLIKEGRAVGISQVVVFNYVDMVAQNAKATTHEGKGLHLFRMSKVDGILVYNQILMTTFISYIGEKQ